MAEVVLEVVQVVEASAVLGAVEASAVEVQVVVGSCVNDLKE